MPTLPDALTAALGDRYRIEREIGQGGMATVYLAEDLKHQRKVAIKVLRPELAAAIGVDRFLAEIKTTAALHHPHILPLHDSCQDASCLYYVMPYVEGESLRDRLTRERQLPVEEALRITREVADALQYAHNRGVIHRDIKPENILLEGGHALLADFGIARAVSAAVKDNEKLTQVGMAVGTPTYMSPEQAAADPDVDGRSDLYSLASVLYEMLVGEPPFTGATHEAILVQRFTQTPPHATAKRPSVPVYLDRALVRALARQPAERFPTVERFAAALVPSAADGSALADDKSVAVLPFTSMSADPDSEYFGDGIAEEIINALGRLPGLRVAARASAFAFRGKADDLRAIAAQLGVRTVLEGSVRRAGNRVRITAQLVDVDSGFQLWSERYDRQLTDIFAIQDEIATAIARKFELALGGADAGRLVQPGTANLMAYDLYLRGRALLHRRGASLQLAIQAFEEAVAVDPDYAPALAGLARALMLSAFWGMVEPGEVLGRASEAAAHAIRSDAQLGEAHAAAALVAFAARFDRQEAEAEWGRAIALAQDSDADTRVARAAFDLGYARAEFTAAAREIVAALELDPLSSSGYASLTVMHRSGGNVPAARIVARRAFELDPESLYAHWAVIYSLSGGDAIDEARRFARDARAKFGRHPWLLMGESVNLPPDADRTEAIARHEELAARSRTDYVQPAVLSVTAACAGRLEESASWLLKAFEIRDSLMLALIAQFADLTPVLQRPAVRDALRHVNWPLPERH
jgi:TolB-like protein/tRNA A-37 threonylcarbamoyl transferase component Bud32